MVESPTKFPKRKQLPYSISVCTTHQKHNCCHKFVPTTAKTTKAQRGSRIHRRKLNSYVWDEARSEPRDPFLCCLFSDMILKECENLAWHAKRKLSSFGAPFGFPLDAQPQGCRGTPLAEAEMPNSLVVAESTGVQTFRKRSPPPRHIAYMIWRSRPMQKADV